MWELYYMYKLIPAVITYTVFLVAMAHYHKSAQLTSPPPPPTHFSPPSKAFEVEIMRKLTTCTTPEYLYTMKMSSNMD